MSIHDLQWPLIGLGALLGVGVVGFLLLRLGRGLSRRLDLEDRGQSDRTVAQPFPRDLVIATYKRRRRYHRHHRRHYQRKREPV